MNHYQIILERPQNQGNIQQNDRCYIDTFQDETISLNYNIADIMDLSNKNSSYSKTIKIPNTKNNQQVFSDIWSLNFTLEYYAYGNTLYFNPNIKVKCYILKDNVIQFEGNLQLTNIEYDLGLDNIVYSVVVYSENDGLFKAIGEKYLSDLDLTRYDHKWTGTNIYNSWFAGYGDGYFYPMIDYGTPLSMDRSFRITDFKPAVFVRTIWKQIFSEAGYSYISDFIDSEYFSHLILPFSNKGVPNFTNLNKTNENSILVVNQAATQSYAYTRRNNSALNVGINLQRWIYFYNAAKMIGDTPIYNPNNLYNFTYSVYQSPTTQRFAQKLKITYDIRSQIRYAGIPFQSPNWILQQWGGPDDTGGDIQIFAVRNTGTASPNIYNLWDLPHGNTTGLGWKRFYFNGQLGYSLRANSQGGQEFYDSTTREYVYRGTITTDITATTEQVLQTGEYVSIFVSTRAVWQLPGEFSPGVQFGDLFDISTKIMNMSVSVIADDTIGAEGGDIQISRILPNIKQKDFVANIMRMFNLYVDNKKGYNKTFIIEPRDDYYGKYQNVRDWSQKLDLSKNISSDIPSNLQARTNLLTYKDDKDFFNTEYKTTTSTLFGEYKFEFENEFSSDEKKIELIFSPTPTNRLPKSKQIYLPSIVGSNNGNFTNLGGFNPRILYVENLGLTQGDVWNFWKDGYLSGTTSVQNTYPFASFANHPTDPTKSLNFGTIRPFYDGYFETQNNLYYDYWQNTFIELNRPESRILEAYFNLTSYDINDFSFADLIYISVDNMAGYYRVNKIADYDPSKYQSTKVQLVKALNYSLDFEGVAGTCPISIQYCLCGNDLQTYLDNINDNYYSLDNWFAMDLNGTKITKMLTDMGSYPLAWNNIVDTINDCCPQAFPGLQATYIPSSSTCSLTFQVEMGEEATNVFLGSLNVYYENNPSDAYVAIYVNYPCGATFGTWVEDDNVFFLDMTTTGGFTQYTFIDWWLNNITGAYGTASGNELAENAYLQLGWNWITNCSTQSNIGELYFTIDLTQEQALEMVDIVNTNYDGDCRYLTFWNTYSNAAYNYETEASNNTIGDIVDWANTIFGMSASFLDGGGVRFYYRQDGVVCDTCNKSYIAKLTMNNTIGSPAPNYVCYEFGFLSDIQQYPCVSECYGEGLNLQICFSNTNYLPGGWTPQLFCDSPLLGPTSGPVYDAGGLTYGVDQDLCICSADTLCFTLTSTLDCPGGVYTLTNYLSDATGENISTFLWESFDDCFCDSSAAIPQLRYEEQSTGFRNSPPLDGVSLVGVINTSTDNLVVAPNNIVLGSGNNVYEKNNIIIGDNNGNITGGFNFVLGQSNSITDTSTIPSMMIGDNIYNELQGGFVFGNNISILQPTNNPGLTGPTGASGSTASTAAPIASNIFVVGQNLTLGGSQSLPANTTYLGSENIIISPDGGFNTPFIISEAVSTPELPTGQSIIKVISGYGVLNGHPSIQSQITIEILDNYYNFYLNGSGTCYFSQPPPYPNAERGLQNSSIFSVDVEVRIQGETTQDKVFLTKLYGGFVVGSITGQVAQVGTTTTIHTSDNTGGEASVTLTDDGSGALILGLQNDFTGSENYIYRWDATIKYQY